MIKITKIKEIGNFSIFKDFYWHQSLELGNNKTYDFKDINIFMVGITLVKLVFLKSFDHYKNKILHLDMITLALKLNFQMVLLFHKII